MLELERSVSGGETADFDVDETCGAAGCDYLAFRDGLDPLGIDDPHRCFLEVRELHQLIFLFDRQEDQVWVLRR